MVDDSIILKTNEKKYLEFTIKDYEGDLLDLTTFSATIQIQKYGDTTLSVNTACSITTPIDGLCRYLYDGSLTVGMYKAEVEVSNESIRYITPTFDINVIAGIP